MKVVFAVSFLFVEGVEEQVRLHTVQQVEECCCIVEANNRFNIEITKKEEHSQEGFEQDQVDLESDDAEGSLEFGYHVHFVLQLLELFEVNLEEFEAYIVLIKIRIRIIT